jgi:hypothetical protein
VVLKYDFCDRLALGNTGGLQDWHHPRNGFIKETVILEIFRTLQMSISKDEIWGCWSAVWPVVIETRKIGPKNSARLFKGHFHP